MRSLPPEDRDSLGQAPGRPCGKETFDDYMHWQSRPTRETGRGTEEGSRCGILRWQSTAQNENGLDILGWITAVKLVVDLWISCTFRRVHGKSLLSSTGKHGKVP